MSQSPLMLSVSGARGIVGETMTPEVAARFARAFASVITETFDERDHVIVLGRDSRPSGTKLAHAVGVALVRAGCGVIDLGVVMTPTVGVMVKDENAAGGMVITASHNPAEWNGLKCLNQLGAAPSKRVAERVIERFRSSGQQRDDFASTVHASVEPRIGRDSSANQVHINRVLRALGEESLARIRDARFKVVLDSINGAGCVPGRVLLETLGCTVVHLNGAPDGDFAHTPEPIEENLRELCAVVKRESATIGFAQDPDGDRLAIVDDSGIFIGEEYTLALCALRALERETGTKAAGHEGATHEVILAANLSTSRMIDDVAAMFPELNTTVVRTAVGEANVVEALMTATMQGARALIGGEGNGGVIYPEVCWVRDSLISMAIVLDLLASRHSSASGRGARGAGVTPLSAIMATLPRYTMIKRKFDLSALGGAAAIAGMLGRVKAEFSNRAKHPEARINDIDGIRIDFPEGWVHLRPSNTEPIVRLIAEGRTGESCESLITRIPLDSFQRPAT